MFGHEFWGPTKILRTGTNQAATGQPSVNGQAKSDWRKVGCNSGLGVFPFLIASRWAFITQILIGVAIGCNNH